MNQKSKLELRGQVKKYLSVGLTGQEIARLLGMSKQAVHYWIKEIRREGKNDNQGSEGI